MGLGVALLVLHGLCGWCANWLLVVSVVLEVLGIVVRFGGARGLLVALLLLQGGLCWSQDRKVQNRPYADLRRFHFGIHVGTHMQDMELVSVVGDDGVVITSDQDRYDPGFNVGVLGEMRLSELFQLRVAPAVYFGSRHIVFDNATVGEQKRQDLKAAYFVTSVDMIFAAPRLNNHRVYMMAGLVPTINMTSTASDYLRLKRYQTFAEVGLGLDRYLPYFKCRPELKFMFGLGNALVSDHSDELRDANMKQYTESVGRGRTKMIGLTIYFE